MKRFLALAGVVTVALAAPATVGAAGKKFSGVFEAGGTNSFTLKKTNNGKKVFNYEWVGFPLSCDGGPKTSSGGLSYAVRVKDREFRTVATPSTIEKAKLTISGKFVGPSSAEGTMRLQGSRVPVDGGGRDACDSGKVAWTAEKLN